MAIPAVEYVGFRRAPVGGIAIPEAIHRSAVVEMNLMGSGRGRGPMARRASCKASGVGIDVAGLAIARSGTGVRRWSFQDRDHQEEKKHE
jgi:hypothetical protein